MEINFPLSPCNELRFKSIFLMNQIQNQIGTQRLLYFYDTKSQLLFKVFEIVIFSKGARFHKVNFKT